MLLPRPEHLTELDQVQGQTYMQLLQEVWTHQSQVLLTLQENKHAKGVTWCGLTSTSSEGMNILMEESIIEVEVSLIKEQTSS
mgnify:CR=1 FL=1